MVFGSVISPHRGDLSLQQLLDLANVYLENARKTTDPDIALVLCHDTEVSLSQAKRAIKNNEDRVMHEGIATTYTILGELLDKKGHRDESQAFYKKAQKWGGAIHKSGQRPAPPSRASGSVNSIKSALHTTVDALVIKPLLHPPVQDFRKQGIDPVAVPQDFFPRNVRPPVIDFKPPEPDTRLHDTLQLACCLGLLRANQETTMIPDPTIRAWLQVIGNDPDEQERLKKLTTDVIRAFKRDEIKDSKAITEVVYLSPVLENDDFRYLLKELYSGIDQSGLLDVHQLEGLAQLIQGADPGYLDTDDLVKVLELLSTRLRDTHQQSTNHLYRLTVAVSHVLDAMADANVTGLDRENLHEPLSSYLDGLKGSSDPYLVYQSAYAYQALLCVPDNESLWQATLRRTGKVIHGVSGLVSAMKGLDINGFIKGLGDIQEGLAGAAEVVQIVKSAYDGASSLIESGQGFFECLKEGLSFSRKCAWYPALRGADTLIRDGQLATFRKLVYEAPCRLDPAFQWGICQRLGEIAANPMWDNDTQRDAIGFLGEIYRNDTEWGQQDNVKQWALNILMQLASSTEDTLQLHTMVAGTLLQEMEASTSIGAKKQAFYQACLEKGPGPYPLKATAPSLASPSLLDRVQNRPDVEGNLRLLRKQRLKERGSAVYIQPQAKTSLKAPEDSRFSLMEKVGEFLASDQKVFLLLGNSGAGKSTFNQQLECDLWQAYKKKTGAIPLLINLPAIDKPEHDMIAKQLRKAGFTEPQIKELKFYRRFVLICDGYDESQQTHNLYASNRLNQPGEWSAQMVISCRSEYIGVDYRDRFQPGDRNRQSIPTLLQEAVMVPFSVDQIQDYIHQYVSMHQPLWDAKEYKEALELIPSLKELVRNPFLMSLSLEVLPRVVDLGQHFSASRITRVALYDQFVELWLERGKKRLSEKELSPQAKAAFESLSDEGFTQNGIDFLKKLSVAIYKEHGGQPIVQYSRYKDEGSWKSTFFSREEEKQLLREACPLVRSGNQHRFIHRSLLEYGLALAIFDPQDWKERAVVESTSARRGSMSSVLSFRLQGATQDITTTNTDQGPDPNSPLVWRDFVSESSILQFLEERVQQEPVFKQQLLEYIEHSKLDKKWRIAAANAITILVRAGIQFNGADLQGVQIPGADLSYGVFDSAQLQGADVREVNFRGAWLLQANLSEAKMTGVQFGELPFIKESDRIHSCNYSPNGKSVVISHGNGNINVYKTSNWEKQHTLNGHLGRVRSALFSPRSEQIASCSQDKTVRLWNVEAGTCHHVLTGHEDDISSVDYSPQGDQVASASDDKSVRLWDTDTGACRHVLVGHTGLALSAMYSPDGSQVASCSADTTVRLWDVDSGICRHTLSDHGGWVRKVIYAPQGDLIASASDDKTARLWSVETGQCLYVLAGHKDWVRVIALSPNGHQLASASNDKTMRLWDVRTGICSHILTGSSNGVYSVMYSPQGDQIASCSDRTVRLWDVETGTCRHILTGHNDRVVSVVYSPSGDQVASASDDKTVRLWNIDVGISRHTTCGHSDEVLNVQYSPKGDQVASCSKDKTIRLWDVESGVCRSTLIGHKNTVTSIAYSPVGDQLASGSRDNTVRIWDVETGACRRLLTGHKRDVNSIVYSPQGDHLASASDDWTLRLWIVETGVCRYTFTGHSNLVTNVAYSPKGDMIASCSLDLTVRVWSVETGLCSHTLTGHSNWVKKVTYSPRGDMIASGSDDKSVRLWDVETGACRHVLSGHRGWICSIAYSPQDNQLASAGKDGTIRLWDIEAGTCNLTLTGHEGDVNSIAYSPHGDMIASASNDKTVRLWNLASGQCQTAIQSFHCSIKDIAWSPISDVKYVTTGCEDRSVRMWQVHELEEVDEETPLVQLRWRTTDGELTVTNASFQDAQGLSELHRQLLEQRGAVGATGG